jgi:hypothetical protein
MVQVLGTHHAHLVDKAIAIQAIFAFAAECLKEDVFYTPLLSAEAG